MISNKDDVTEDNKDSANTIVHLSLSYRSKEIVKDIAINTKTNSAIVVLNHDCKKVIVSHIYKDWNKTSSTFKKQAERKGLSSEDTDIILDEFDNNHETILEHILNSHEEYDSQQIIKTKKIYIRKYSGNTGNLVPLSESIIFGGIPNFLQVAEGNKPVLLDGLEIGHTTFCPYDTIETHNPIPYLFESVDGLNTCLKNAASYKNLDSLFLKVKSIFKKYVDAEDRYITLLAASTILSYYQDRFGTMHYIIIVGDNGSGKNSALLVYRLLGYRVFYVTAASAANYYTFLGDIEEGQGTLAEDEADNIHLQPDKYKVCKTGYASGGSVPKVDIHNTGGRSQGVYLTFCMKWFAMEELPDYKEIKGLLDRSFVLKFVVGRPKYNIKDVIKNGADPKFRPLYDELLEVRKQLLMHRMLHYNDVIYDVKLNIRNRNEELTKPLIRLFRNSPIALSEILPVLSEFLNERNDVKKNSFESRLFQALKNLIKSQDQESKDTHLFSHEDLCAESRTVMDGNDISGKPQSFYTVEFGSLSHKKIIETFRSKFKAKPYQTGGTGNKRCLIFSKEVIDKIAIYYDNPDRIEILSDDTQQESDTSTNGSSDSNLVLHNIKESDYDEPEQQEKESVTDVTNITDSNDAKALDKALTEDRNNRNKENNSNNIDKLSNSYNNLDSKTLHSSSNNPALSSGCVISVTSVTKNEEGNEDNNNVSLEDLPTLSCLYCPTYKTKIRFDMELHLFEKHKENLVYNLPVHKASMDDRIDYALDLIEQGALNAESHPSSYEDWEEENDGH